jgi:hypothetical protein
MSSDNLRQHLRSNIHADGAQALENLTDISNDLLYDVNVLEMAPVKGPLLRVGNDRRGNAQSNLVMREGNALEAEHVICIDHEFNLVVKAMDRQ